MVPTKLEFLTDLSIGTETKAYTEGPNGRFYRLDCRDGCEGVWTYHNGSSKAYFVAQTMGVYFRDRAMARSWAVQDAFGV